MLRTNVWLTLLGVTLITAFQAAPASAQVVTASSCRASDVQRAVDTAPDGGVVSVPAGVCNWDNALGGETALIKIVNKNVTVQGAGVGQTVINHINGGTYAFYVYMSNGASANVRITGFTFQGDINQTVILFTSSAFAGVPSGRWRVDHNLFNYPTGQRTGVWSQGVNYGVIDHNTFNWRDGVAVRTNAQIYNEGASIPGSITPLAGDFINSQPLDYGTDKFVFIEDNVFTANDSRLLLVYDSSAGGGRMVFRHNTVTGGVIYNHWTRGEELGGQVHEIYNNTFIATPFYDAYPVRLEAGTGVFYNNALTGGWNPTGIPYLFLDDRRAARSESGGFLGVCDGSKSHDGNFGDSSAPGWPCLGQIGRAPGRTLSAIQGGSKQVSSPFQLWNNGTEPTCATGGSCTNTVTVGATPSAYIKSTPHPNGEVDYVDNGTPKPGYTPFVYPHPLVSASPSGGGGSSTAPAPPPNVRVVSGS